MACFGARRNGLCVIYDKYFCFLYYLTTISFVVSMKKLSFAAKKFNRY